MQLRVIAINIYGQHRQVFITLTSTATMPMHTSMPTSDLTTSSMPMCCCSASSLLNFRYRFLCLLLVCLLFPFCKPPLSCKSFEVIIYLPSFFLNTSEASLKTSAIANSHVSQESKLIISGAVMWHHHPCRAQCDFFFRTIKAMHSHLTSARSCTWYG